MNWNYYHFKKQNTEFTRNWDIFKNSYVLKNDEKKELCTWITISIYYNMLQKNCSTIHSYEKGFFGKKYLHSFFIVIMLVHCIPFAPY